MTMTNRYDPSRPEHKAVCTRTTCSDVPAHQAGQHLDQRSEFYDGPDTLLQASSMYIRASARKIITEAPELTPEVVDLVTYIGFLKDQTVHAQADRDRGIREAGKRALDCDAHGEAISALEDQVARSSKSARSSEAGRLAALGFLFAVDDALDKVRPDVTAAELIEVLKSASKKAHAAHGRAWKN